MNKLMVGVVWLWIAAWGGMARPDYQPVYAGDFSTSGVAGDFTYSQLGNLGANTGAQAQVFYTNQALRMQGRQAVKPSLRLASVFSTHSLAIDCSFRLFNTVTTETFVALGWRVRTNATANTYPLYYVALDRDASDGARSSIQVIKKWEYAASAQKVLARYDYTPTPAINSNLFTWSIRSRITGTNQFGDALAISLVVSNGGMELCSLSVVEPAMERSGSNWTFSSSIHAGIGMVAGSIPNDATFRGLDLAEFRVSEDKVRPVSVPEFTLGAIGNSFTYYNNSYPFVFYDLAAVGGHTVAFTNRALAGRTLKQHCTETNTLQWIAENDCQYFIINELSLNPTLQQGVFYPAWRTNEFPFYADRIISAIQSNHPGAQIFLYEPWAPKTNILAMSGFNSQPDLTALYTNLAAGYENVDVMPFGRAIQRVHLQHANPDPPVLSGDASEHPGAAGTYLLACVVYARIYGESPEGRPYFKDTGVATAINLTNRNYAHFLQRVAYDTYRSTMFTSPPAVVLSAPDAVAPGIQTPFSVSATDDGAITNYLWSFGDGSSTNGPGLTNVVHSFSMLGGHDVSVAVQDDAGEWERFGRWVFVTTNIQSPADPFSLWLETEQGRDADDPDYAPGADVDQDGATTWDEFLADTDPADSNSLFQIHGQFLAGSGNVLLTFPASSNRYYLMDAFTNLLAPGSSVSLGPGIPGMVITNPADAGAISWRVRSLLEAP